MRERQKLVSWLVVCLSCRVLVLTGLMACVVRCAHRDGSVFGLVTVVLLVLMVPQLIMALFTVKQLKGLL